MPELHQGIVSVSFETGSLHYLEKKNNVMAIKTPNFEEKVGKHPIPHAKGVTNKDNRNPKSIETNDSEKGK